MDQGFAFYSWAIENDGWLSFNGIRREGDGYKRQEVRALLKMVNIEL